MSDHLENRDLVCNVLMRELVGPNPVGEVLQTSPTPVFVDQSASYGPWQDAGGQEILQRDRPSKRYGIGVLYPFETVDKDVADLPPESDAETASDGTDQLEKRDEQQVLSADARKEIDSLERIEGIGKAELDDEDLDLTSANTYRPSSMAVSFATILPEGADVVVLVTGGRYKKLDVQIAGTARTWWLRSSIKMTATFKAATLSRVRNRLVTPDVLQVENLEGLDMRVEIYCRPAPEDAVHLLTVCLVNRKPATSSIDEYCLFQSHFRVEVRHAAELLATIQPYPSVPMEKMDEEELNLALLYRDLQTFAIGHGCAADWTAICSNGLVSSVSAECLPSYEAPSIAADLRRADGTSIDVSMAALANLVPGVDGLNQIEEVIEEYRAWIENKREIAKSLGENHRATAALNLDECSKALSRMKSGLSFLKSNAVAMKAFRLANHAILLQQIRDNGRRDIEYDADNRMIRHSRPFSEPDPLVSRPSKGRWRPFQIAFFVMTLESTANSESLEREAVELIWFPTGGGKTEAYLGLSAFSMFFRRLQNPQDVGVDVLMRYTLRLLTAQQFQRAAGLICAMEYLRLAQPRDLGTTSFSIGIWLGGETTPNSSKDAVAKLSELQKNPLKTENPFLVTKCPWCAAQLGVIKLPPAVPKSVPRVWGYERRGGSVFFKCTDRTCPFSESLPIFVIDEEVYANTPSLIIGTVDKFAMLAWLPKARGLFGLSAEGARVYSPPNLIIQDELHLISGPLGTMVGLYEVLIEELCSDYRSSKVKPKIVSSTATIRRYRDQIRALYAREDVSLFPPSGLDAGDSFFAQYARDEKGNLRPGRRYVGVHAPGLGSLQTTQVRTFSALLQAAVSVDPSDRDPWWTLVAFFNSLRELGTTLSLFQSDIPDYLKAVKNRNGLDYSNLRRLKHVIELTGRLTSEQIPESIEALERAYNGAGNTVDVCLASNILEVGIDIERLSMMTVVGQPKTTSQYIQVTGRVGRRWWEQPGLIVTIYGASKPRDRSHFEKFRSYHERLYAQVEPTSVTPYSPPALDRGLHAVMVAYTRQTGDSHLSESPYPVPEEVLAALREILVDRVSVVDPQEKEELGRMFDQRIDEWRRWERVRWSDYAANTTLPLLRVAGAYCSPELARISWPTAQSMRNVDAECQIEITNLYIGQDGSHA
jgi:hypothetical protein